VKTKSEDSPSALGPALIQPSGYEVFQHLRTKLARLRQRLTDPDHTGVSRYWERMLSDTSGAVIGDVVIITGYY